MNTDGPAARKRGSSIKHGKEKALETIGILGLGYVGLPLAVEFAEAGKRVVCGDVNAPRVAQRRRGASYLEDIPSARLQAVRQLGVSEICDKSFRPEVVREILDRLFPQ